MNEQVKSRFKSKQSQWNKFRIIYGSYRLFIEYNTLIETSSTSIIGIGQNKEERLEFIKSLSDKGMSNREITDYLNSNGYKTPNGNTYYPNLIWGTLKKYKKRLDRKIDYKVLSNTERLLVQPIQTITKPKI